mmetsp:Transcript_29782/g.49372  ORF Transcript_29782/g.49372 Transcript_29782/m.49372 type:complete len:385 (-) Transcript_29782:465-1619(-)
MKLNLNLATLTSLLMVHEAVGDGFRGANTNRKLSPLSTSGYQGGTGGGGSGRPTTRGETGGGPDGTMGGQPGDHGGEDSAGNNLAEPVLCAEDKFGTEGTSIGPIPRLWVSPFQYGYATDDPEEVCLTYTGDWNHIQAPEDFCYLHDTLTNEYRAWLQRSAKNTWGGWVIPASFYGYGGMSPFTVTAALIGDRLESPGDAISAKMIRVEVTLYQDLNPVAFNFGNEAVLPMALPMVGPLLGSENIGEIHGTTAFEAHNLACSPDDGICEVTSPESNLDTWVSPDLYGHNALVFTSCAKYIIQQGTNNDCLFGTDDTFTPAFPEDPDEPGDSSAYEYRFDVNSMQWIYVGTSDVTIQDPVVTPPATAEITVSGKIPSDTTGARMV